MAIPKNGETPITAATEKNVFRLYEHGKRLDISLPDVEDEFEITHPGKTVAIDLTAMNESSRQLIRRALWL